MRLVYLNLKIGNESYRPLELPDEFLPERWVWANTVNEPMLSLPEDYTILSLGLLNYQVRSMNVQLKDQPRGCLISLKSSCQNMAVGRILLENAATVDTEKLSHKTQVVCVVVIKTVDLNNRELNKTEYHCCGMQNPRSNGSQFIRCNLTVNNTSRLDTFDAIFALYIPALPLALPDCVFSVKCECDKEDRFEQQASSAQADSRHTRNGYIQINNNEKEEEEADKLIPVEDASPMTFSTFLLGCVKRLPDVRFSFNIKF